MDRPSGLWRVAAALMLSALIGALVLEAGVARAAEVDDTSDRVGQVNALFLAGFYRRHLLDPDDSDSAEIVELSIMNASARSDNSEVDALVLVYNAEAQPIGCGIFSLQPNEITDPIDLEELTETGGGLKEFGTVLVVVTPSNADFIGTGNDDNPKKKKKDRNRVGAERGVVAYISQTDGTNTLSQVRLQPFRLDDGETDSIRSEFVDSSFCDGGGSVNSLSRPAPATVQTNAQTHDQKKSKAKSRKATSTRKAKTSFILTKGGNDSD